MVAKVAAIVKFPPPSTVRDLLRYLGMLHYYRRFLSAAAQVLKPLSDFLSGNVARSKRLTWSPEMSASFAASKHLLPNCPHPCCRRRLRHSHWGSPRTGREWFKPPTWIFQKKTVPHRDALRGIRQGAPGRPQHHQALILYYTILYIYFENTIQQVIV